MDLDLELVKRENEPKIGITVRIYESVAQKIEAYAQSKGVKPSWLIRHAINNLINEIEKETTTTSKKGV